MFGKGLKLGVIIWTHQPRNKVYTTVMFLNSFFGMLGKKSLGIPNSGYMK